MTSYEYRILEVPVRTFPTTKVPAELGSKVEELAASGWELDRCEPVMAKGLIGGSYTAAFILFFRRVRA